MENKLDSHVYISITLFLILFKIFTIAKMSDSYAHICLLIKKFIYNFLNSPLLGLFVTVLSNVSTVQFNSFICVKLKCQYLQDLG